MNYCFLNRSTRCLDRAHSRHIWVAIRSENPRKYSVWPSSYFWSPVSGGTRNTVHSRIGIAVTSRNSIPRRASLKAFGALGPNQGRKA